MFRRKFKQFERQTSGDRLFLLNAPNMFFIVAPAVSMQVIIQIHHLLVSIFHVHVRSNKIEGK